MSNRLAHETSPYLLQHQHNPVDWRAWGAEALAEATARDVPVLVSIGYSACHWCHVMERESFEDEGIAALMNDRFVCIKVDREERPDVDAIYMEAVQAMTGHGGWPLNAFLTPEGVPFFGGTYFPPTSRQGMPGWPSILEAVAEAWTQRRDEIRRGAPQVLERLRGAGALAPAGEIDPALPERAVEGLQRRYDRVNGGFGTAPKFPPSPTLEFLLGRGEREMSLHTLRAMAAGGIHDQLGGGFARYAVDATWTVPHFEKMLYDNALLARAYLHGHLLSGDPALREVCERTLDWALREMRAPDGGFHAALDADSEGEEGRYYVWSLQELREVLGDGAGAREVIDYFGATAGGNFEGARNVLLAVGDPPPDLPRAREALLAARQRRVRPREDDKRVCSWNALMISALADAGATLGREDYLRAAIDTAELLTGPLRIGPGRLHRTFNRGQARLDGVLEDHAYALEAMLALYEATFDARWFAVARELADGIIGRFGDPEGGGFFTTAVDVAEPLVVRRKDLEDAPIPSGQASAARGLLRLGALTGEARYATEGERALRLAARLAATHPQAFGHWLGALDFHLGTVREVAVVGDAEGVATLAATVRSRLRPHVVLAGRVMGAPTSGDEPVVPLLEQRGPVNGRAAAYVCQGFVCRAPVTDPRALSEALAD